MEDDGKAIDFQPVEFVVGGNGRIGVKGIKYTPKTTGGIQVAADGSVSIGGGGAPQEEVWIDYDRNEAAFDAQLGVNIYDKLGRARPTGGTSTQPNKSETAVERAVRIANGG